MTTLYIVLHVRPGFEDDAAQEILFHLNGLGVNPLNTVKVENSGLVCVEIAAVTFEKARLGLRFNNLIFVRQLLWSTGVLKIAKDGDRISGLLASVHQELLPLTKANAFSSFSYETPDTDEAKELSGYCKSLSRPTENALNKLKILPKGKGAAHLPRLHLLMTSPEEVWPTFSDVSNSSPWPMGIPRLKFPANAPSRSTLKLEEAFITFLGHEAMDQRLTSGMTAVDLGACPGGWTYQLVKRGIHVAAIDNGSIDSALMDSGLVEHLRTDAFTYRPGLPVDWLVCDVVEQPARISELMTDWITAGWCKEAIFNLKLPMKKRWEETKTCLEHIFFTCQTSGVNVEIQTKQLYHDRKEVTVHIRRT